LEVLSKKKEADEKWKFIFYYLYLLVHFS